MKTNYKNDVIDYYYNNFFINSDINSPMSVGWSDIESQIIRFQKLLEIGVTVNDKILDLGCGLGHMVDFLQSKGYDLDNYCGIDINPIYVINAIMRKPGVNFKISDIHSIEGNFDYILGSGVFTVKTDLEYMLNAIDVALNISNKGVAFNFLNKNFIDDINFNTFEPNILYNKLSSWYPNTVLVNDYLINEDFTIYIYK